jgi:hypothetical protein
MTTVRMEDVAKECGTRFLREGRELSLDAAKNAVRLWFEDMEAELKRELQAEYASQEQRHQFRDVFEALRASVVGTLQSVAQPQPRIRDQHASQGSWEYEQQQRQQQRGGGNFFSDPIGWVINSGSDSRRDQPPEPPRAAPAPVVKTDTVYQQVLSACALLDKVLAAAEPREEPPVVPWAEADEFLAEAQRLFAAHIQGNGERALKELGLLEERLKARYGVEVIWADDSTRRAFRLYPNELPGDGSFETKLPAIAVHGRIVLRGEALGPAMTPPADQRAERERTDGVQRPQSSGDEGATDGQGGLVDGY